MASANWADLIKDAAANGGGSFEPLPDGDYDLKITEASHTVTQTGKVMFKTTNTVQTGPHANRKVWDNLVVSPDSPGALGYFFRKMKALGLGTEFFASQPTEDQIAQNLLNKSFRGKLTTSEYNGKLSNNIKEYHPATGGLGAPGFAPAPVPASAVPPVAQAPAPAPVYQAPVAAPPAPASPWETAPAAPVAGGFAAPPAPPF